MGELIEVMANATHDSSVSSENPIDRLSLALEPRARLSLSLSLSLLKSLVAGHVVDRADGGMEIVALGVNRRQTLRTRPPVRPSVPCARTLCALRVERNAYTDSAHGGRV